MDLGILKTETHTFPIYLFSLIIISDKYFMASKDLFHELTNVTDRNHLFSYLSWKIFWLQQELKKCNYSFVRLFDEKLFTIFIFWAQMSQVFKHS